MAGARLKRQYSAQSDEDDDDESNSDDGKDLNSEMAVWFGRAQEFIDEELQSISEDATDGQIDVGTLSDEKAELLQLYLDQQESWQAVCLVVDVTESSSTTLVLNRPMAMKLTENLGQLVLYGAYQSEDSESGDVEEDDMFSPQSLLNFNPNESSRRKGQGDQPDLNRFMKAFGSECAVYIGGMCQTCFSSMEKDFYLENFAHLYFYLLCPTKQDQMIKISLLNLFMDSLTCQAVLKLHPTRAFTEEDSKQPWKACCKESINH